MAVDAALLESAAPPTLRLYGWRPHAVSLGYFQRSADFDDIAAGGTPIVRRSTGGGAIHHGDELTFSLVLEQSLLPADVAASYALLHEAVRSALADVGVPCSVLATGASHSPRPEHRWCFREPVLGDLVTERGKLCGSAQRRIAPRASDASRAGATSRGLPWVLHHGSLVLERPEHTPFVAAVADQQPTSTALRVSLRRALCQRFAETLGLRQQAGNCSQAERALASQLLRQRYGDPAFVRRR
ncbi:MAG: biotin/lipoate A/B protein ligase family protein [Planctomycetota bacterium]